MSKPVFAYVVLTMLTGVAGAAAAADGQVLRDPQNVVFEGVNSFDVAKIRNALSADIDMQVAVHPRTPLAEYLKTLEANVSGGYRRGGFESATASARVDPRQGRVIVRVQEGARFFCGDVQVRGLDDAEAQSLVSLLTEKSPSTLAVPINVTDAEGKPKTIWEKSDGKPAKLLKPVWPRGEPARLEKTAMDRVEKEVNAHFWIHGRAYAKYRISHATNAESKEATLVVEVTDRGTPVGLGTVHVEGAFRNTAKEVLDYLGLKYGTPYHSRIPAEIERRLWESGRFYAQAVRTHFPHDEKPNPRIGLTITVSESPYAPPLAEPLSREQQLLLKMREWISRWSAGDRAQDLICEVYSDQSPSDGAANEATTRYHGKILTSPRLGQAVTFDAHSEGKTLLSETMFLRENHANLFSSRSATHLELKVPDEKLLLAQLIHEPGSSPQLSYGFAPRSKADNNLLSVQLSLAPAALLEEFFDFELEFEPEPGLMRLEGLAGHFLIEEQTGRPREFRYNTSDGSTRVQISTEPGRVGPELAQQQKLMAQSKNMLDPEHPWKSIGIFALDEYAWYSRDRLSSNELESLAALRKLLTIWNPDSVRTLSEYFAFSNDSADSFFLPVKPVRWSIPYLNLLGDASGTIAGVLISTWQELSPAAGPWWPLGREALFVLAGRSTGSDEALREMPELKNIGPISFLIASAALQDQTSTGSIWLASQGLNKIRLEDFRRDYASLLTGDSWLSRNLLSLAESLRQLDDAELRGLARLVADGKIEGELTASLLLLKADRNRSLRQSLPTALDRLWNSVLQEGVVASLKTLASGKTLAEFEALRDVKFRVK